MGKTAFLILAHHQPEMVRRLTDRLQHSESRVFIHVDGKVDVEPFRAALSGKAVVLPDRQRVSVHWCGYSTLAAMMRLIWAALDADPDTQRFVMLSGVDYPVLKVDDILKKLSGDSEFISVERVLEWNDSYQVNSHAHQVYLGDNEFCNDRTGRPLFIRLARAAERRLRRKKDYGADIFHGSGWWALTREMIDFLIATEASDPRSLSWFRWSNSPDELYFHTMAKRSPRAGKIVHDHSVGLRSWPDNLHGIHYIDWRKANPHLPRTLELSDLPDILASGALFARKMDRVRSASLMDRLDLYASAPEPVA